MTKTRTYTLVIRSGEHTDVHPLVLRAIDWLTREIWFTGEVELSDETGVILNKTPVRDLRSV